MSVFYGRTAENPGNNLSRTNIGTNNQIGSNTALNVPAGLISFLDVFVSGDGVAGRVVLCLWDASGNLLAQTAQITTGVGSSAVHGQAWQRAALTTPYRANATASYYIGFWRNPADQVAYSYVNSGGVIRPDVLGSQANVGSPGALAIGSGTTAQLSAYLEWDPGNIYQGPNGGGVPVVALASKQGPAGGGAPIDVLGVYQGPNGGGVPIRIW